MTTSNEGFSAAVLKKMKEEEDEKKRQAKAQVLIEDGTMSAFGFSNTCEVEAKQK